MADNDLGLFTLTSPVVMAHPNLFSPRPFKKNGKEVGAPKFSGNFIIDPQNPDLAAMKAVAIAVAKARWPGRDLSELAFPFSSGTQLANKRAEKMKAQGKEPDGEYQRGMAVIAARSKYQPGLAYLEGGRIKELTTDEAKAAAKGKFFFGAEVLAQFKFVTYEGVREGDKDGVNVYLQSVLATGKGKRIGGEGRSAAEVFKGYVGSATTEDPTANDEGQQGIPGDGQW